MQKSYLASFNEDYVSEVNCMQVWEFTTVIDERSEDWTKVGTGRKISG
jgi:hypothetical protein